MGEARRGIQEGLCLLYMWQGTLETSEPKVNAKGWAWSWQVAGASLSPHHFLMGKLSPHPILGLYLAFCHISPFLGSTSIVFKASLRQSMWTRYGIQCLAPHHYSINTHFCPKCYLQHS